MAILMAVGLRTVSRVGNQRQPVLPIVMKASWVGETSVPPIPRCRNLVLGWYLTSTVGCGRTSGRLTVEPRVVRCDVAVVEPAQPVDISMAQTAISEREIGRVTAPKYTTRLRRIVTRGREDRHLRERGLSPDSGLRPLRRRRGHERLAHDLQHLLARAFLHRLQAAEL